MKNTIRLMQEHDLPDLLKIEKKCFPESPLKKGELKYLFGRANVFCVVCEHHERVVGFIIYEVRRKHIALLNFAVDPAFWRKGIAKSMLQPWINAMSFIRTRLTVIVKDSNLAAQMLMKSLGFKAVVILQSPYEGIDDDGYLMEYLYRNCHELESANS